MAGIILESGVVLVPLACAALYLIISSNMLLFVFATVAATVGFAVYRLRYHYSSGARGDLVVRTKDAAGSVTAAAASPKTRTKKKAKKNASRKAAEPESDHSSGGEFDEIVQDAQRHCDVDSEVVERSGALLAAAVTPEKTKYDMELYGSALSYDHRCFYICGRPTWVLAADFDYWRVPIPPSLGKVDQITDTWRRVLLQYKAAGFNAVRIRFHWGFHSPSKGKYDFTGCRDVNRLLLLCEELGILVIACLGPFIGDDVQGGGYPFWLIQRDHIRLRHLSASGVKIWDDRFAAAEGEWYDQLISMLVGHEVMTKSVRGRGCIIMVQLENHLGVRGALELPLALQDETRLLARMARERVIRAPLVTNNLRWPDDFTSFTARTWAAVEKKLRSYRIIKGAYHSDISGFTVRDVASQPVDLDAVARVTKGDNAPMAALELYKPNDESETGSFGRQAEAAISQGLSVLSLPAYFSMGSWGNLDSPLRCWQGSSGYSAVSADGSLSADARSTRLVLHIARAFELQVASSDSVSSRPWIARASRPTVRGISVSGLPADAVRVRRQWEVAATTKTPMNEQQGKCDSDEDQLQTTLATYVDGQSAIVAESELAFLFTLAGAPAITKGHSFALTGTLGPRQRGIFISNLIVGSKGSGQLSLVAASKEIYTRVALALGAEVWVCAEESIQEGQLFFDGECKVSGHAEVEIVDVDHAKDHKFSFVIPKPGPGVATVTGESGATVHIVLLAQSDLDTLVVDYGSFDYEKAKHDGATGAMPAAAWGADGILMASHGSVELVQTRDNATSRVVVVSRLQPQGCTGMRVFEDSSDSAYHGHRFIWHYVADTSEQPDDTCMEVSVRGLERRITNWDTLPWKLLPTMADLETMDEINLMSWQRDLGTFAYQATDIGFNASHVLHRCQVRLKPQHLTASTIKLQLNVRHRCTVWVNGINMSGHETFHEPSAEPGSLAACIESMRNAGAACGPDRWGGTATYDVTKAINISAADDEDGALNEVIVVIESYGLGTQADGANDARAPRGLLAAYWHGFNLIGEDHDDSEIHDHSHDKRTEQLKIRWEICGVDVTQLQQPYGSSGFPDEGTQAGWQPTVEHPFAPQGWSTRLNIDVNVGVQWWHWKMEPANEHRDEPVYLTVSGKVVAYVWVNGLLLAKHRASTKPSSVLLRGGLYNGAQQAPVAADEVVVMLYGWADDADTSAAGGSSAVVAELSINDSRGLLALDS
ncbi:hypothetical protein H4218_001227 [Coemansia sp. IMI 209128]|nr:hypothetical protein H4218_001227 [Coemansia sp. IMI 209128]